MQTITVAENPTTLTIKKNIESLTVKARLFTLNHWHDVVIELNKGLIVPQIDGVRHIFDSEIIDMSGHAQIDFKAVNFRTCQIDHIRLWEGS